MSDVEDWSRLGREVRSRREALGLGQDDLGVSDLTVRKLENDRAGKLRPQSLRAIEQALHWLPGIADRILNGSVTEAELKTHVVRVGAGGAMAAGPTESAIVETSNATPAASGQLIVVPDADGAETLQAWGTVPVRTPEVVELLGRFGKETALGDLITFAGSMEKPSRFRRDGDVIEKTGGVSTKFAVGPAYIEEEPGRWVRAHRRPNGRWVEAHTRPGRYFPVPPGLEEDAAAAAAFVEQMSLAAAEVNPGAADIMAAATALARLTNRHPRTPIEEAALVALGEWLVELTGKVITTTSGSGTVTATGRDEDGSVRTEVLSEVPEPLDRRSRRPLGE